MNKDSRVDRIINRVLDTATEELEQAGVEGTRRVISALKEWLWKYIQDHFGKIKSKQIGGTPPEMTLDDLNKMISQSEEHMELGRKDEENRVWWAMRKLNYSEEQIQQVLDLANEA